MRSIAVCKFAAILLFCATITRVAPAQTFTSLVNFEETNGASPLGALLQGPDGAFYGTTEIGGNFDACGSNGCGTVFKVTPQGTLTTGSLIPADGIYPSAGFLLAG